MDFSNKLQVCKMSKEPIGNCDRFFDKNKDVKIQYYKVINASSAFLMMLESISLLELHLRTRISYV